MGTISAKDFDEGYCKAIDDVMSILNKEDRTNSKFFFPLELMRRIKKMGDPQDFYKKRKEAEKAR
ncbi:MAG: hypothetical protein IJ526_00480 [Lachnospiraceae bacterium]|nr:hypothetical protein [Lachnospiraceae bacterium]